MYPRQTNTGLSIDLDISTLHSPPRQSPPCSPLMASSMSTQKSEVVYLSLTIHQSSPSILLLVDERLKWTSFKRFIDTETGGASAWLHV